MASLPTLIILSSLLLSLSNPSIATPRKRSSLAHHQPLVLNYHKGTLLKGNLTVDLLWYGSFTPVQHTLIVDFLRSFDSRDGATPPPSVASWWATTHAYGGGRPSNILLGRQIVDDGCSLGKSLRNSHVLFLASRAPIRSGSIVVVLTADDVAVEGFCMNRCGTHRWAARGKSGVGPLAYAWVGNSVSRCPGQCAWPFHQPLYGPQMPPLVAPNGDVGVDGMVITLATVLAGTVTNPFSDGYFQGPADAPLEAVSACTGIFGAGAYPGYPGSLLVDSTTGGSYNAKGVNGRKYLMPAMWDPKTSMCKALV